MIPKPKHTNPAHWSWSCKHWKIWVNIGREPVQRSIIAVCPDFTTTFPSRWPTRQILGDVIWRKIRGILSRGLKDKAWKHDTYCFFLRLLHRHYNLSLINKILILRIMYLELNEANNIERIQSLKYSAQRFPAKSSLEKF